jgi:hypothetical protein
VTVTWFAVPNTEEIAPLVPPVSTQVPLTVPLEEDRPTRMYDANPTLSIQVWPMWKGPFGPFMLEVAGPTFVTNGTIATLGAVPTATAYAFTATGLVIWTPQKGVSFQCNKYIILLIDKIKESLELTYNADICVQFEVNRNVRVKLEEIKGAVRQGKKVHWSNTRYEVIIDSIEQFLIVCDRGSRREHCIGLTWRDGTTMNGKEEDFFIGDESWSTLTE